MPHRRLANAALSDVWRTVAAILAAVLLGVVVLVGVSTVLRNREAIEKSCILLNNVIIRSGAGGQQGTSTKLLVGKIVDTMTKAERERYFEFRKEEREDAKKNPLTIDCKKVASDPDSIRAIQVERP